ncbi:hypothetical protein LCGC14_2779870 [marine sediment metagenome]|uniref:Uncharacterized protein n=1 Tax=marine sediment metagenome TaxID=412755 RepID=A0A0F8YTK7_9ZZZZ
MKAAQDGGTQLQTAGQGLYDALQLVLTRAREAAPDVSWMDRVDTLKVVGAKQAWNKTIAKTGDE